MVFRTSIIVGFPGEKEEEFEELCTDLKTLNLDHVGVFRFSKEEGTKAAEMDEQIHPGTKRRRSKILLEMLKAQRQGLHEKYIGTKVICLVEGPSEETELLIAARMTTQAQEIDGHVLINDTSDLGDGIQLRPGDLVEVEVTEAMPQDLIGRATRLISESRIAAAWASRNQAESVGLTQNRALERPAGPSAGEAGIQHA